MGYVEEDDEGGEQSGGEADKEEEPELGEVGEGGHTQLGCAGGHQTGQAGHAGYLK